MWICAVNRLSGTEDGKVRKLQRKKILTNRFKYGIFKTDIIPSSIIGNDYQFRQEEFHESVQSHAEYGYDEQHAYVLCICVL